MVGLGTSAHLRKLHRLISDFRTGPEWQPGALRADIGPSFFYLSQAAANFFWIGMLGQNCLTTETNKHPSFALTK